MPTDQPSLLLARSGAEGLPVVYAARDETGRFAAVELARFLSRLAAARVDVLTARPSSGPCLELVGEAGGVGGPDGFRRTVTARGLVIEAATGRGLLSGVYDLLEDLGCRWYYPGPIGQRVPHAERDSRAGEGQAASGAGATGTRPVMRAGEVRVPFGVKEAAPALPGRSLILGHDLYLADVEGWIEWAARNRLSSVFLHIFPPVDLGGRPAGYWRKALARAVPAARRRGLEVEFGGHGLAALLPRRLFRSHPDYFRFDGRRRTPDHNFCPLSEGALAEVRRNARVFFEAHPGADVYHLWPDDIVGGGWCRCEKCAGLSASDQALLATNAAAEVLAEVAPGARLAYLAYHDTVEPPRRARPAPNVSYLFAPRERCYAHALDDPGCEVNRGYHANLVAGVEAFRAADTRVFEYYLDAILFKSMLPPLPALVARDLRAYRDAGVGTVGVLQTADRPWVGIPPNLWLFARLAWHPGADQATLLDDFARGALGRADLAGYFGALERAFALALNLDGQPVRLTLPGGNLVDDPPGDTLDFLGGTPEAVQAKLGELREAGLLISEAGESLDGPGVAGMVAEALAGERAEHELVRLQSDYLEARQAALAGDGEALRRAWRAVGRIRAWGRRNLAWGVTRLQFAFVHAQWELQLLKIERMRRAGLEQAQVELPDTTAAAPTAPAPRRPLRLRDVLWLGRIGLRLLGLRLWALGLRPPTAYHRSGG